MYLHFSFVIRASTLFDPSTELKAKFTKKNVFHGENKSVCQILSVNYGINEIGRTFPTRCLEKLC